jgi:hypothetical protein
MLLQGMPKLLVEYRDTTIAGGVPPYACYCCRYF